MAAVPSHAPGARAFPASRAHSAILAAQFRLDTNISESVISAFDMTSRPALPEKLPPLTRAQMHILLALAEGERHGYAIMREVEEETGGQMRLGPGTLYGAIKTLLGAKFIVETAPRIDPDMDAERRRYYKLTDLGRRVLTAEMRSLADVVRLGREHRILAPAR